MMSFKKFPELGNKYWKGKLWSPSYYVGAAGRVSVETIQRYIEERALVGETVSTQSKVVGHVVSME